MYKSILLFLLAALLLTVPAARACSCLATAAREQQQIATAYAQDALIFIGRVIKVETVVSVDTTHAGGAAPSQAGSSRRETYRYTFAISRLLKGRVTGRTVFIHTETSSSSCGVSLKINSRQLVHAFVVEQEQPRAQANATPAAPYYATSLCHRTKELKYAKRTELQQLYQLAKKSQGT